MLSNISVFVFLFGILACSERTSKKENSPFPEIKVLSYNIHHANPPSKPDSIDLKAIVRVIKESGAELVALQEVDVHTIRSGKSSHQAEALGELTDMEVYFSKGIDFQGGEYGTAILSKFPIIDTERHELPNLEGVTAEPRTLAVATVNINGMKIKLANTHLDFSNSGNNLLQVKTIMNIFKGEKSPVIIGGDFNAVPESPSIQLLDEHFTRSCLQDCPFTSPQHNPKRVIDYILVSSDAGFEAVGHKVIEEVYASDHRPVFAVYRFMD